MKTLITICARGGSKGIPGKNIKLLNGKPLIYYTLKIADEYASLNQGVDIMLSTDSEEIKNVVKKIGFSSVGTGYSRPKELASDSSGKMGVITDVLRHAEQENNTQYDYVMDLDVTSPLRTIDDLNLAFEKLEGNPKAINIFSVSPANRNPYFNMVEQKPDSDFIKLVKEGNFVTRQAAPKVYDVNASFYIYRNSFFQNNLVSALTNKTLVYEVPHLCFDLDHPIDYDFMSFLLENNKLDFDFLV